MPLISQDPSSPAALWAPITPSPQQPAMGFWLGTFIFLVLEVIGFAVVHFTGKRGENL